MMLRLLCHFVGLVAAVSGVCKDPFVQVGDGCYYFSSNENEVSWYDAREYCHSLGADVDLAVFDYLCDDFQQVADYILTSDAYPTQPFFHIGATGGQLSWFWMDGRSLSVSSSHWNVFGPDVFMGDSCVDMYQYAHGDYKRMYLGETGCEFYELFICQQYVSPIASNTRLL